MLTAQVSHSHARSTWISRTAAALLAALLAVGASILTAPAAHAAPVGPDANGLSYETAGTEATVTGYDDSSATLTIPSTISDGTDTYTVTTIGNSAFSGAPLTTVTIPDSVITIGRDAFSFAPLTTVTIGNSVTTIDNYAFSNTSLATVTIPDSVTTIGFATFWGAPLTSASIGNSVTTIGGAAFENTNLTTVTIGNSVTTIGSTAFLNTSLSTVTIPDSVTSIGGSAFGNTPLTSASIGNSVTTIGSAAFAPTNLTTVTIPDSVTSIGAVAFAPSLTSAVFQGAPPTTFTAHGVAGSLGDNSAVVHYPSAFAADYAPGGATTWQGYTTAPWPTMMFDMGGHGVAVADVNVFPGATTSAPAPPTAAGFTFLGWFTASTGGTTFDFAAPRFTDATAFAQWDSIATVSPAATLPPTGADPMPLLGTGALALLVGALTLFWTSRRRAPANQR